MHGAAHQRRICIAALLLLVACGGPWAKGRTTWRPPETLPTTSQGSDAALSDPAEHFYAAAVRCHAAADPACVDHYFQAAACCWGTLEGSLAAGGSTPVRASELYHSALAQLLVTAQQFGRWDPHRGVSTAGPHGPLLAPARYEGFLWKPEAFSVLNPCGTYADPDLVRQHRCGGLGVALVAQRNTANPAAFTHSRQVFAATVVLRPNFERTGFHLQFYDPLRVSSTPVGRRRVGLARDLSAPFALIGLNDDRQWIDGFLRPNDGGPREGLFMIEPFQPGKIPVVLVHGLLSDPRTWIAMTNELRAQPDLNARFQWLGFDYATGGPFLESAARLRQQLSELRRVYDPGRRDPALSRTVLVGHSMGGLVSKLQVTESGRTLWDAVTSRPFESLNASPGLRRQVREEFFFHPSPDVTRVVYIATPHLGSYWANRPVGRWASAMVRPSAQRNADFARLMRDNPGLLRDDLSGRMPTSIDLLEPNSRLLQATAALPYNPAVTAHTIYGVDRTDRSGEPIDGIVPAWSARLGGVATEREIDGSHLKVHKDLASIEEVGRILRLHLAQECGAVAGGGAVGWD